MKNSLLLSEARTIRFADSPRKASRNSERVRPPTKLRRLDELRSSHSEAVERLQSLSQNEVLAASPYRTSPCRQNSVLSTSKMWEQQCCSSEARMCFACWANQAQVSSRLRLPKGGGTLQSLSLQNRLPSGVRLPERKASLSRD